LCVDHARGRVQFVEQAQDMLTCRSASRRILWFCRLGRQLFPSSDVLLTALQMELTHILDISKV